MTEQQLDRARSEAFAERMLGVLNSAGAALMTSVGHRTGLFDAMANLPPSSSEQIAKAAGLHERYVREWLGAMVTSRIVQHDAASETYVLPKEHAAWLTRAAGLNNLALQTQYLPLMATVEQRVIECFRQGGGVPYSAYPRFQELMAEESGAVLDAALIDTVLPLVPALPDRLRTGIDVLDVGCGRGHAVNLMARAFPKSRFTGYDFSEEGITAGRDEAKRLELPNARFEVHDAAALGGDARYDLITAFDAIHDQAHPARVLEGISRSLRPDGVFLMVDIRASSKVGENVDHPLGTWLYTVSCFHCMTVSLALNGTGLGTVWGEQTALRMLAEAGFPKVEVKQVEGDLYNSYYVARKS